MKTNIIAFCNTEPNLQAECLSPEDWDNLTDMHRFLKPFYDITMATQSVFDAINKIFPAMDYLLTHFKDERHNCTRGSFMAAQVNAAWSKFVQYYAMTDDAVAYFSATTLNFIYKWNYFDRHWGSVPKLQKNLRRNKQSMQRLWEDKYKSQAAQATTRFVSNQSKCSPNGFINWIQQQMDEEQADELSIYLNESCLRVGNPGRFKSLDWWLEASQKSRYPALWRMAVDVLSIPAMAASTERLFSECKISCERSRMSTTTLKDIHLLRSWQRSTILDKGLQVSKPLSQQLVLTDFRHIRRYSPKTPISPISTIATWATARSSKNRMKAWVTCHDTLQGGDSVYTRATEGYAVYWLARGGINVEALRRVLKSFCVYQIT